LEKGEVATQGYESEDVKILETPEERQPIPEPTAEEPATEEAFAETTAAARTVAAEIALEDVLSSQVDSPTIEVSSAKTVVAGVTFPIEITPAMTISTRVTTANTSAPSDMIVRI